MDAGAGWVSLIGAIVFAVLYFRADARARSLEAQIRRTAQQ